MRAFVGVRACVCAHVRVCLRVGVGVVAWLRDEAVDGVICFVLHHLIKI